VLAVLVAIFTFFAFIDQLEDVGRGSYTLWKAATFVVLMSPSLTYQLFPMAALIGSLIGFGTLMRNGEVTVIRAAGVSKQRLVGSVLKSAWAMLVLVLLLGEGLAPPGLRMADDLRSASLGTRPNLRTASGFWARDGRSYVNIRQILPGDQLRDIYIYEFDDLNRLHSSTYAESAHYVDGGWILENIARTDLDDEGMRSRKLPEAAWDSIIKPDLLAMVAVNPDSLGIVSLARYIRFLSANAGDTQRYQHALWRKLSYPMALIAMVLLAIPMVLRADRSVSVGQRVLVGAMIGLGFHLANQAAGHLGVVYDVPPILSAGAPTALMLAAACILLVRAR
jgi:lipopolysaccharide export system permease protein